MHMPKSNVFAYVCCMALGVVFIVLAVRGRFTDPLGNIILGIIGAAMVVGYAVVIARQLRDKKNREK